MNNIFHAINLQHLTKWYDIGYCAIKGICEFHGYRNKHIITVATEHKAVLDTCKHLQRAGVEVSWLPVSLDGRINTDDLLHAIRDNTILISVMYANNETGVVQDIEAIASLAAERSIAFFVMPLRQQVKFLSMLGVRLFQ